MQNILKKIWTNNCENEILQKPKHTSYILFKNAYCKESYVNYCMHREERSLLAQIRFGMLPLYIETGRFRLVNQKIYCVKFPTIYSWKMNSILYLNVMCTSYNSFNKKCAIYLTL